MDRLLLSLVNQRVLYAALTESQWGAALSEIYRVLALGWMGPNHRRLDNLNTFGTLLREDRNILDRLCSHKGLVTDVAKRLPGMLAREGFISVHSETRGCTPWGMGWHGRTRAQRRPSFSIFRYARTYLQSRWIWAGIFGAGI